MKKKKYFLILIVLTIFMFVFFFFSRKSPKNIVNKPPLPHSTFNQIDKTQNKQPEAQLYDNSKAPAKSIALKNKKLDNKINDPSIERLVNGFSINEMQLFAVGERNKLDQKKISAFLLSARTKQSEEELIHLANNISSGDIRLNLELSRWIRKKYPLSPTTDSPDKNAKTLNQSFFNNLKKN